jgi:hypothetical protein
VEKEKASPDMQRVGTEGSKIFCFLDDSQSDLGEMDAIKKC